MVDLSGGSEGPLEHAFSNSVFIVPGIIVIGLSDNELRNISLKSSICRKYSPKMDTLDKGTLDKLQELIEASSEPGKQPNRKVLLELLDTVELADDVKENLKAMLTGDVPKVFGGYAGGTILAIVFILLVFAMILFFGYKLYKSIKEKEIKREEKKKAKQMKKKK